MKLTAIALVSFAAGLCLSAAWLWTRAEPNNAVSIVRSEPDWGRYVPYGEEPSGVWDAGGWALWAELPDPQVGPQGESPIAALIEEILRDRPVVVPAIPQTCPSELEAEFPAP